MNWRPDLPAGPDGVQSGNRPANGSRDGPLPSLPEGADRDREPEPPGRARGHGGQGPARARGLRGPGRGPRALARFRRPAAHGHLPPELHPAQPDQPHEAPHLGGFAEGHGTRQPYRSPTSSGDFSFDHEKPRRSLLLLRRGRLCRACARAGAPTRSSSTSRSCATRRRCWPSKPFAPRPVNVPESLLKLNYDQYRDIRFRPGESLWRRDRLPFELQFFHPGFSFDRTVQINVVDGKDGRAGPVLAVASSTTA